MIRMCWMCVFWPIRQIFLSPNEVRLDYTTCPRRLNWATHPSRRAKTKLQQNILWHRLQPFATPKQRWRKSTRKRQRQRHWHQLNHRPKFQTVVSVCVRSTRRIQPSSLLDFDFWTEIRIFGCVHRFGVRKSGPKSVINAQSGVRVYASAPLITIVPAPLDKQR